jgi:hypothetical protein
VISIGWLPVGRARVHVVQRRRNRRIVHLAPDSAGGRGRSHRAASPGREAVLG